MSDENKLNVKFEWFPEFGKLLINLVSPGKDHTLALYIAMYCLRLHGKITGSFLNHKKYMVAKR